MKLLRLTLSNFKGIKHFVLDTQAHNAQVFGDNATGKTTLYDAFLWLLFDKDSQNKKDFAIKTLASDGSELHGLEHSVEGSFEIDGRAMTLTKSYMEQWTKKRGSAEKTFTGHTTQYFIDSVPVKKKEYESRIAGIVNEDVFRLLTNPAHFNEHLNWQDRRKILLEVCGDITDEMVIASDKSLKELPEILKGRKLDDHKKVIAARRTKINDELKKIPVRIDEVQRSLPDIDGDPDTLLADMAKLKANIKDREQELARIESGGEIAEKTVYLRQMEAELIQIKNDCQGKTSQTIAEKTRELNIAKAKIADIEDGVRHQKQSIAESEKTLERVESELAAARERWFKVDSREFTHDDHYENCPFCGQSLPQDQIASAREKALAQFNQAKATEIELINADGQRLADKKKNLAAEVQAAQAEIANLDRELPAFQEKSNQLQVLLESLIHDNDIYKEDPAYIAKSQEIETLRQTIDQLRGDNSAAVAATQDEIRSLNAAMQNVLHQLARHDQVKLGKERIAELSDQERDLAAEYEKLEKELYLTEQFVRTKVAMLEEKINSKFKMARFKLFDVQINGGVVECCETTYKGVPYGSGLNNAARINVGLDIINTLADHYDFDAPIFIDNREAVTNLIETRGQVISLIVSGQDKSLRVETAAPQQTLFKEVI